MAGLIALLGVALILCVVAFPTPSDIPVGDMAYQKLCLGRMAVVFIICCLFSFSDKKYRKNPKERRVEILLPEGSASGGINPIGLCGLSAD